MTVVRSNKVMLTGSDLTVRDLREFLSDLQGAAPETPVGVQYYAGDQRDRSTLTLTVSLPVAPHRPPASPALQFPPGVR